MLEICARRSIRVVPLIFWTRAEAEIGVPNTYRQELVKTFKRKGFTPIDFGEKIKKMAKITRCREASFYENGLHYSSDNHVTDAICEMVCDGLDVAATPLEKRDLFGRNLILTSPASGATSTFKTGVYEGEYFPANQALHIPASGMFLASFVVASQFGAGISISIDGKLTHSYSLMAPSREKPPFRLIKHLVHSSQDAVGLYVNSEIVVARYSKLNKPIVQNMFAWRPDEMNVDGADDGYIYALVEIEEALGFVDKRDSTAA